MKNFVLTTVSAIALMTCLPAMAEMKAGAGASVSANAGGDLAQDAKEAWKAIKKEAAETYQDIKAVFIDQNNQTVVINTRHTATGMIGKPVYNAKDERVGTVKDVIVDADGNADMVVIADGEFPGFDGKLVAFDYDMISRQDKDGDVIAAMSEGTIERAAEFSYDMSATADGKVRVIPDRGYSVAKLLSGKLVDPQGDEVADIEDISFKNDKAAYLIVGFDKTLGLGGKTAALNYDATRIVSKGDEIDFKLTAKQADRFEAYKKTVVN